MENTNQYEYKVGIDRYVKISSETKEIITTFANLSCERYLEVWNDSIDMIERSIEIIKNYVYIYSENYNQLGNEIFNYVIDRLKSISKKEYITREDKLYTIEKLSDMSVLIDIYLYSCSN